MPTKAQTKTKKRLKHTQSPHNRLAALKKLKGLWKGRKPNPIKELRTMRKEWDR